MLFSSLSFLFYFLPIVLLIYALTPKKLKNTWLLLSSLVFYGWGEPRFVLLMVITILIGYILGLCLSKTENALWRKILVALGATSGIGILIYFKYADFFISSFNQVTGLSINLLKVALPIGISFYTFQMLSYVVDVYRKEVPAQKNPITLATYIAMFPQLIAGPIVRYKDIVGSLEDRTHTLKDISYGIRRFAIGLGKKVLLANTLGELVAQYEAGNSPSVLYVWIYVAALTMQIYFDFSGYSDMAIGLGYMLGFKFPENFNYPLSSKSITDFWRRWHMTLGSWFRDYLYIPMGGNRVSVPRHIFNILIVWMATGFWHGASWNYVIWGLYFAILLVLEKNFWGKKIEKIPVLNHVYLLFFIAISFVIFHSENTADCITTLKMMFGFGGVPFISSEGAFEVMNFGILLIAGILGSTAVPKTLMNRITANEVGKKIVNVVEPVYVALLLVICTAFLVNGSFNPFLYFRF